MPLPRKPQTARRTRSFAPSTLSGCTRPRAAMPAPAFKKFRRFASESIPIMCYLSESGQYLQQSLERFARALDLIAVRPKVMRLKGHCAVIVVIPERLDLSLPIDDAPADRSPLFLAGRGALSHILDVHVREQPFHICVTVRIRYLVQHRGIAGVPVAAQSRRIDLFEQTSHFHACTDVAGMLVFKHENDIVLHRELRRLCKPVAHERVHLLGLVHAPVAENPNLPRS